MFILYMDIRTIISGASVPFLGSFLKRNLDARKHPCDISFPKTATIT